LSSNFFAAVAVMVAVGFAGCAATSQIREAAALSVERADHPATDHLQSDARR
jgi:hypothetical protein